MNIGAAWTRTTKDGKKFLSGVIEYPGVKLHVALFKNEKKEGNQPDFNISWMPEKPKTDYDGVPFGDE